MTKIQGQLLRMITTVATALGDDLGPRLVFVGGSTTALFITDTATLEDVRVTDDVDLIVDLAGYPAWAQLQDRLREKGFVEAADTEVICRMKLGELTVDFMPDDPSVLGFGNRWYALGIETAETHSLESGVDILVLTPALFVATKLEAYKGRGKGDLFSSRDAEDILLLVDGRETLTAEIAHADDDVRRYIAECFRNLLADPNFDDFVDGNIRGPAGRSAIVRARFVAISQSDG